MPRPYLGLFVQPKQLEILFQAQSLRIDSFFAKWFFPTYYLKCVSTCQMLCQGLSKIASVWKWIADGKKLPKWLDTFKNVNLYLPVKSVSFQLTYWFFFITDFEEKLPSFYSLFGSRKHFLRSNRHKKFITNV